MQQNATECISHSHSRWKEEYGKEESWKGNEEEEVEVRMTKRVTRGNALNCVGKQTSDDERRWLRNVRT